MKKWQSVETWLFLFFFTLKKALPYFKQRPLASAAPKIIEITLAPGRIKRRNMAMVFVNVIFLMQFTSFSATFFVHNLIEKEVLGLQFSWGNYCPWPKWLLQISVDNRMSFISTDINSLLKVHFTMEKQIWKFSVILSVLSFLPTSAAI